MDKNEFTRFITTHRHYSDKKVDSIEIKVSSEDLRNGEVRITDLQVQDGTHITGTIPNTREILSNQKFTIDESYNAVSSVPNHYEKEEPQIYENIKNRFFNFANRGHAVMAIPNVFHEDYREELVTSGIDLTIYPKDDYDLLRISTNYGSLIEEKSDRLYTHENLTDHPLNYRYTKEFCFPAGKAEDEIKLFASTQEASVNGRLEQLGITRIYAGYSQDFNDQEDIILRNKQRFMSLPWGSNRIRIEFYKLVEEEIESDFGESESIEYLEDAGIGYWGIVEFTQWKLGRSRF